MYDEGIRVYYHWYFFTFLGILATKWCSLGVMMSKILGLFHENLFYDEKFYKFKVQKLTFCKTFFVLF